MTIHVEPIKRIRAYEEPNGSFASDHTGTLGDFVDIPAVEGSASLTLTQQMLEPQDLQQRQDDWNQDVLGLKRASLQFEINLAPTGSAAGSGTAAQHGPIGRLLKAIMGAEFLGTGGTIDDTAPTAHQLDYTAGSFDEGSAVGWVNSNGEMEAREVATVTASTVTMRKEYSETPSDTDVLYASATYALAPWNGDSGTSLQLVVEGLESDDRWVLLGGQAESVSLNLSPSTDGVIPRLTVNLQFAHWIKGADAATDLTASALAAATYSQYSPVALNDGELYVPAASGTSYSASDIIHASAIEFNPNISYQPITSPSGTQIILQWARPHSPPAIQGTFTLPYEDLTWFDARDNRTEHSVWFQIGRSAGGSVMLSAPSVQITDVQRQEAEGIAAQQVSWKGRPDNYSSGSNDINDAPFRIHLL